QLMKSKRSSKKKLSTDAATSDIGLSLDSPQVIEVSSQPAASMNLKQPLLSFNKNHKRSRTSDDPSAVSPSASNSNATLTEKVQTATQRIVLKPKMKTSKVKIDKPETSAKKPTTTTSHISLSSSKFAEEINAEESSNQANADGQTVQPPIVLKPKVNKNPEP
ncbi:unnamed protein product, partial [Meganyctiphanes norvegica]